MKILILNGPNLNLIGKREPAIYGKETFESILKSLEKKFPDLEISYFQSNSEGALIDRLQQTVEEGIQGIVLNAGAFSHYSIALLDALRSLQIPKVEVHLSNIYAREPYRAKSVLAEACQGIIAGFGPMSYALALQWFLEQKPVKVGFKS